MIKEPKAILWGNMSLAIPSFVIQTPELRDKWCSRFAATDPEIVSSTAFINNSRSPAVSPLE